MDLRAKGGFLVSSELTDGSVSSVKIESTAGGDLQLLSPWKVSKVRMIKDDGEPQTVDPDSQNIIRIKTVEGESIILQLVV